MVAAEYTTKKTEHRYTTKQFYELVQMFDQHYQYELHGGVIHRMPPANMVPAKIGSRIGFYITTYLIENNLVHLTDASGGYDLSDEDTFTLDVGFLSYERLPEDVEKGFIPHAPDLAIEVVSPSDTKKEVRDKTRKYLTLGTKLVWIVYPKTETVEVCRINEQDVQFETLSTSHALSGENILPDFTLPIDKIFAAKKSKTDKSA